MPSAAFALLLALSLGGCPGGLGIQTISGETATFTNTKHESAAIACPWLFFPLFCGPDVAGTGLFSQPPQGKIIVGYDYWSDPGTQPCPCWEYSSTWHRGFVQFRTKDLPDQFALVHLVLAFGPDIGSNAPNQPPPPAPPNGVIGSVYLHTGPDTEALLPGFEDLLLQGYTEFVAPFPEFPDDPSVQFKSTAPLSKLVRVDKNESRYLIDVTSEFREAKKNNKTFTRFRFEGTDETNEAMANRSAIFTFTVYLDVHSNAPAK
jgi:hypothetical protein